MVQEISTLQKAVVKRFEIIEEIIRTEEQGKKVQVQDFALAVYDRVQDVWPGVLDSGNILWEAIWY